MGPAKRPKPEQAEHEEGHEQEHKHMSGHQDEVGSRRGSSPTDPEESFHRFSKAMDCSTRSVSDVSSYLFPNRTGGFHRIRLSRHSGFSIPGLLHHPMQHWYSDVPLP